MKIGDNTLCKEDFGSFSKKDDILIIKNIHIDSIELCKNIGDTKYFTILKSYFSKYFMNLGEIRDFRIDQILE